MTTSSGRRRRAKGVEQFRDQIAGASENDTACQHAAELKRREKPRIIFWKYSPQEALAMEETMNITYHQFKLQSMFLKSIGAALPNEHAGRVAHKNINKGEVEIKKKIFDNSKGSAEMN